MNIKKLSIKILVLTLTLTPVVATSQNVLFAASTPTTSQVNNSIKDNLISWIRDNAKSDKEYFSRKVYSNSKLYKDGDKVYDTKNDSFGWFLDIVSQKFNNIELIASGNSPLLVPEVYDSFVPPIIQSGSKLFSSDFKQKVEYLRNEISTGGSIDSLTTKIAFSFDTFDDPKVSDTDKQKLADDIKQLYTKYKNWAKSTVFNDSNNVNGIPKGTFSESSSLLPTDNQGKFTVIKTLIEKNDSLLKLINKKSNPSKELLDFKKSITSLNEVYKSLVPAYFSEDGSVFSNFKYYNELLNNWATKYFKLVEAKVAKVTPVKNVANDKSNDKKNVSVLSKGVSLPTTNLASVSNISKSSNMLSNTQIPTTSSLDTSSTPSDTKSSKLTSLSKHAPKGPSMKLNDKLLPKKSVKKISGIVPNVSLNTDFSKIMTWMMPLMVLIFIAIVSWIIVPNIIKMTHKRLIK